MESISCFPSGSAIGSLQSELSLSLAELHLLLDKYTRAHSYRVEKLVMQIGMLLSLPSRDIAGLRLAARYHDLGKIAINPSILTKSHALSRLEREEIRMHPEIGASLWLQFGHNSGIAQAILTHHERYNGSGYPLGLCGARIPLWGRIIAVADALDAMVTKRAYNVPLDFEEAVYAVCEASGSHFDPEVVEALFEA